MASGSGGEGQQKWLVVGLGNPGREYQTNRHNIGFMVVDSLAERAGAGWKRAPKHQAELATGLLSRRPVVLLKPQTYMNLSGESVSSTAHYYRIPGQQIIAIHDDIDLDLGRLKVKQGGGDGGHKGIRSIAQQLGSPDFLRVRVGVGRPSRGDVTSFVLGGFRAEERESAEEAVGLAAKAVGLIITRGVVEAMNRLNRAPKAREAGGKLDTAAEESKANAGSSDEGQSR